MALQQVFILIVVSYMKILESSSLILVLEYKQLKPLDLIENFILIQQMLLEQELQEVLV